MTKQSSIEGNEGPPALGRLRQARETFDTLKLDHAGIFKDLLASNDADIRARNIRKLKEINSKLKDKKDEYELLYKEIYNTLSEELRNDLSDSLELPKKLPAKYRASNIFFKNSFIVFISIVGIRFFSIFQPIELFFYDKFMQGQKIEPDKRILVIGVSQEDYDEQTKRDGEEPIDQSSLSNPTLSLLLTKLQCFDPIAVGLDIQRNQSLDEQLELDLSRLRSGKRNEIQSDLIRKNLCKQGEDSQLKLVLENLDSSQNQKKVQQQEELLKVLYAKLEDFFVNGHLNNSASSKGSSNVQSLGRLFSICKAEDNTIKESARFGPPPSIPASKVPERVGFSDFPSVDNDGNTLRRHLLAFKHSSHNCAGIANFGEGGKTDDIYPVYTSFSLLIANHYLKEKNGEKPIRLRSDQPYFAKDPYTGEEYCDDLEFSNDVVLSNFEPITGGYQGYSEGSEIEGQYRGCQILLKYRGYNVNKPEETFETVSVEKVLDMSSEEIEENNYKNRIILIGVTRYGGVNDYWLTPYGEISGVMIQAHMVSQILDAVTSDGKRPVRSLIQVLPELNGYEVGEWGLIFIFSFAGGFLGIAPLMEKFLSRFARQMQESHLFLVTLTGLSGVCYWFSAFVFSSRISLWLPFFPCVLALWSASGLVVLVTRNLGLRAEKDLEFLSDEINQND